MEDEKDKFVTTVAILTRRLKKGKSYDDFRKAWYHTTGFGVEGKEKGGSNKMFSLINVFDPNEIVVLGFATTTLEQLKDALNIDISVRGENPLDEIIEPDIGRKFCALISEDDFSAVGEIAYKPASIAGKETNLDEFNKTLDNLRKIFADASKRRDELNEARKRKD